MSDAPAIPAPRFVGVPACWVCGGRRFTPLAGAGFDLREYVRQDPDLSAYTAAHVRLQRCQDCGFGQPAALPDLPRFFDRLYDQRWSDEWLEREFTSAYKDLIFRRIVRDLGRLRPHRPRRLLDVGAHVGRFIDLAARAGWQADGVELNPRTAAYARRRTGAVIMGRNAHDLPAAAQAYDAVTLIDVLEHIPDPVALLARLRGYLVPHGALVVKVPNAPAQLAKERLRALLTRRDDVAVAGNLVHVNHFCRRSLPRALVAAGFDVRSLSVAPPELIPDAAGAVRASCANTVRMAAYSAARLPGGLRTPLAFNLIASATRS